MSYVVTYNSKPVTIADTDTLAVAFMERANGNHFSKYELTGTGKLMAVKEDRKVFTGWEMHEVSQVVAR